MAGRELNAGPQDGARDDTNPEATVIDWEQPWFTGVAPAGALLSLEAGEPLCDRLNRLLVTSSARGVRPQMDSGKPIVFAPQADLPEGTPYEKHIHDTGRIPTRDNLHDLFNGLAWLSYPHIKSRLNATQAHALAQPHMPPPGEGGKNGRGALRDAVTLFDENGLVLACSNDELATALRRFDWQTLFQDRRTASLVQTEPWVVGHALLVKLMNPYKSITAHTLIVPVDDSYFRASFGERRSTIDRLVSDWLANWPFFTPRDLSPLPVLGLPGWWAANTAPGFYDDTDVFRPGRSRQR